MERVAGRRPTPPNAAGAWLDRLIEAELADRRVRSLRYQLKAARFSVHRDLTGIEWAETPLSQAQKPIHLVGIQRRAEGGQTGSQAG